MNTKGANIVKRVYFISVAVMMYYFLTEYINLGIHVTFRHAFALVLFASSFLLFLVKPNIGRGVTAFRSALVYSTPLLVTTAISLWIWFMNTADTEVISRGLSGSFIYVNMLSSALGAGAFLYVFGEKGIWYNLVAILAANLIMITSIILKYGPGRFFSEFITLILSFAGQTGDVIVEAEIHELAFCLGAYLIYMLLRPRKQMGYWILLGLTVFCFLASFKRIGIIAVAAALVIGYALKLIGKYSEKSARLLLIILTVTVIVLLVAYIAAIKWGAFEYLEKAGINTNGRADVYQAVDRFYEFDPGFIGNGIGFLTYQLNTHMTVGVASVHNDFLQHFIDLGFWGYILWLIAMTAVRIWYFGKNGNTENAIVSFVLLFYLIIVSSTDNTINYPLLMGVLALLMMGCNFNRQVQETEMTMFGCVSKENNE